MDNHNISVNGNFDLCYDIYVDKNYGSVFNDRSSVQVWQLLIQGLLEINSKNTTSL